MRQRLGLAMSLLSKPEIMILDEPINGLDPEGILDIRNMLAELVRKENMTILISSHILKELSELCTDYAIVKNGTLIEELSAEELLEKTSSFLRINTNDISKTTAVLEEKLGIHNYKVTYEKELLVYEMPGRVEEISRAITDSGLTITRLNPEGESLEDYYIGKVGGENE
jgi:ABC-type multidrug transport system, ATPase component